MRIGLISDVHANALALEAVARAIERADVEEIWCLGDTLGMGPDPDECAEWVRARCSMALLGNHDRGVLVTGPYLPGAADDALDWSRCMLSADGLSWLRGLSPTATPRAGIHCFHGGPVDPLWQWLSDPRECAAALSTTGATVVCAGHTHRPAWYRLGRPGDEHGDVPVAEDGETVGLDEPMVVNPGAVGRPQFDGDPRAAYAILDLAAGVASWHRVEYDVERLRRRILSYGLPSSISEGFEPSVEWLMRGIRERGQSRPR